jgi:hypothetical protein
MREQLTVLNAFVHDVATGTWISSLVVAGMLRSELRAPQWASCGAAGGALARSLMTLTWVSLGVIVLTGVFRMLSWKAFGWTGDVAADRVRLLKIKHAVLGIVFVAGTAWQALATYS